MIGDPVDAVDRVDPVPVVRRWVRALHGAVVLVASLLAALAAVVMAVGVGLCGLFGEQCSEGEQSAIDLGYAAATALVVAGPVLTFLAVRRAAIRSTVALSVALLLAGATVFLGGARLAGRS